MADKPTPAADGWQGSGCSAGRPRPPQSQNLIKMQVQCLIAAVNGQENVLGCCEGCNHAHASKWSQADTKAVRSCAAIHSLPSSYPHASLVLLATFSAPRAPSSQSTWGSLISNQMCNQPFRKIAGRAADVELRHTVRLNALQHNSIIS